MILQALCGYYGRASNTEGCTVAKPGYSLEGVSGEIVLSPDGRLISVIKREEEDANGKKTRSLRLMVPLPPKRSGQRPEPAFLYEKAEFIFGVYKNIAGAQYRFDASRTIHETVLKDCDDEGAQALLRFYAMRRQGEITYDGVDTSLLENPALFMVFRLSGDTMFLHERPAIQEAWARYRAARSGDAPVSECLVTGKMAPLARIHGNVKGFGTDKPTLVGFNQPSFCSFGKFGEQGANAPVSEEAAFEYVTALNILCASPEHYIRLADTKLLFWAERDAIDEEAILALLFGSKEDVETLDTPQQRRVRAKMDCIMHGGNPQDENLDPKVRFFLLGVSANKTRMVVRFFYESSFGDLLENILAHYRDIGIEGMRLPYPSPTAILLETAVEHKYDNIPPLLEPALLGSIINGTCYPNSLYQAILRRVRAEKNLSSLRAGIIKGYLNRKYVGEAITMALNDEELDRAYLLGRLFALYELAQKRAIGDVNSSITDKYLNSVLATPRLVFATLGKLNQKHLSKTGDIWLDKQNSHVMSKLSLGTDTDGAFAFPKTFDMNEQGKFLLGYYHQKHDLYQKKNVDGTSTIPETEALEEA